MTDWRCESRTCAFWRSTSYLADLNVLVDELGGYVDLIGLCQGGWLALTLRGAISLEGAKACARRSPDRRCRGDLAAFPTRSRYTAGDLPRVGQSRRRPHSRPACPAVLGSRSANRETIHALLQSSRKPSSPAFRRLEARFRDWYGCTVDLPGTYYLQVVEQFFRENRLATGRFVALGRPVELSGLRIPLFLLAARDDDVVAGEQMFAIRKLVDRRRCAIDKAIAPCGHLGLFMGEKTLTDMWRKVADWLRSEERFRSPGRVRRRQRHNRADSQMRAGRADQTRRPKSAIAI